MRVSPRHPSAEVTAATPHRHPLLLLDRLLRVDPGRSGAAEKAVSANEVPVGAADGGAGLPRSLVVDALGQLAIAVLAQAGEGATPSVYYLAGIESMELDRPPRAGDLLRMEATVRKTWGRTSRVHVRGEVDGLQVAQGTMVLARREAPRPEGEAVHV
ncbi:MAG: hydroxymyristoyl-ACP dehydratase [Vicinamibacteria bacterium]